MEKQKEKLTGPIQLLKESWKLYRANTRTILFIMLVPLVFFIVQRASLYLFSLFTTDSKISLLTVASASIILSLVYSLLSMLATMALVLSIRYRINNAMDAYSKAISLFFSYLWVVIITALVITGGLILFIIPGVIFAIWFIFSQYAFLIEEKKGYEALKRSKELVKGRAIDVIYRIIIIVLITAFVLTTTYFLLGIISLGISIVVGKFSIPVSSIVLKVFEIISGILHTSLRWLVITPIAVLFWIHLYDLLFKDKSSKNNT